jgi:hypothetical protein
VKKYSIMHNDILVNNRLCVWWWFHKVTLSSDIVAISACVRTIYVHTKTHLSECRPPSLTGSECLYNMHFSFLKTLLVVCHLLKFHYYSMWSKVRLELKYIRLIFSFHTQNLLLHWFSCVMEDNLVLSVLIRKYFLK